MAETLTPNLSRPYGLRRAGSGTAADIVAAVAMALLLAWNGLFIRVLIGNGQFGDFGKFYRSAMAWRAGGDMYWADAAHTVPHAWNGHANLNPPHATVLVLPFTRFPPLAALGLWAAVSTICLGASLVVIKRELRVTPDFTEIRNIAVLMLAFVGTTAVLATGQSAWMLTLPMTLAWKWARTHRWILAGIAVGACLSVKPFLLVFLLYFVLRRRWGALVAAAGTAAACFLAGLLLFGVAAHRSWLDALGSTEWAGHQMNASLLGALARLFDRSTDFAALYDLGPDWVRRLWLFGSALVGATTLFAVRHGDGTEAVDRSFALLTIAALLISPLGWVYYLWLFAGPMAALSLAARREPRDRISIVLFRVAVVGFIWPFGTAVLGQPNRIATVTIGSVYFWALMTLWVGVLWPTNNRRLEQPYRQ